MTDPEKLEAEIDALDAALSGATGMAASFNAEMKRIHETFSETGGGVRRRGVPPINRAAERAVPWIRRVTPIRRR